MATENERIVASIGLDDDAPIGTVFDFTEPDQWVEEKYLGDWRPALTAPAWRGRDRHYCIVADDITGRKVLQRHQKKDSVLVAGDDDWGDCTAEARIRQLTPTANPSPDDENLIIGRSGIVVRQLTVRRYYFFYIEAHDRFVLYRRRDEEYTALGAMETPINRTRYYDLRVEAKGSRLRCYVDGEMAIDVEDAAYPTGKCAIRSSGISRIESAEIRISEEEWGRFQERRNARIAAAVHAGESMPKPVLWKELELGPGRVIGMPRPGSRRHVAVHTSRPRGSVPPTIFLLETVEESGRLTSLHAGGSDGLFFGDGRTGKVLAHHMLGHVQHVQARRFRPDLPGLQACASCRWGNFGIMTILDNEGRELCQWQPDYAGEAFTPVRWLKDQDLILINRTAQSQGLWNGWGRKVVELPEGTPATPDGGGQVFVSDVCGDERQELIAFAGGKLRIYTQD